MNKKIKKVRFSEELRDTNRMESHANENHLDLLSSFITDSIQSAIMESGVDETLGNSSTSMPIVDGFLAIPNGIMESDTGEIPDNSSTPLTIQDSPFAIPSGIVESDADESFQNSSTSMLINDGSSTIPSPIMQSDAEESPENSIILADGILESDGDESSKSSSSSMVIDDGSLAVPSDNIESDADEPLRITSSILLAIPSDIMEFDEDYESYQNSSTSLAIDDDGSLTIPNYIFESDADERFKNFSASLTIEDISLAIPSDIMESDAEKSFPNSSRSMLINDGSSTIPSPVVEFSAEESPRNSIILADGILESDFVERSKSSSSSMCIDDGSLAIPNCVLESDTDEIPHYSSTSLTIDDGSLTISSGILDPNADECLENSSTFIPVDDSSLATPTGIMESDTSESTHNSSMPLTIEDSSFAIPSGIVESDAGESFLNSTTSMLINGGSSTSSSSIMESYVEESPGNSIILADGILESDGVESSKSSSSSMVIGDGSLAVPSCVLESDTDESPHYSSTSLTIDDGSPTISSGILESGADECLGNTSTFIRVNDGSLATPSGIIESDAEESHKNSSILTDAGLPIPKPKTTSLPANSPWTFDAIYASFREETTPVPSDEDVREERRDPYFHHDRNRPLAQFENLWKCLSENPDPDHMKALDRVYDDEYPPSQTSLLSEVSTHEEILESSPEQEGQAAATNANLEESQQESDVAEPVLNLFERKRSATSINENSLPERSVSNFADLDVLSVANLPDTNSPEEPIPFRDQPGVLTPFLDHWEYNLTTTPSFAEAFLIGAANFGKKLSQSQEKIEAELQAAYEQKIAYVESEREFIDFADSEVSIDDKDDLTVLSSVMIHLVRPPLFDRPHIPTQREKDEAGIVEFKFSLTHCSSSRSDMILADYLKEEIEQDKLNHPKPSLSVNFYLFNEPCWRHEINPDSCQPIDNLDVPEVQALSISEYRAYFECPYFDEFEKSELKTAPELKYVSAQIPSKFQYPVCVMRIQPNAAHPDCEIWMENRCSRVVAYRIRVPKGSRYRGDPKIGVLGIAEKNVIQAKSDIVESRYAGKKYTPKYIMVEFFPMKEVFASRLHAYLFWKVVAKELGPRKVLLKEPCPMAGTRLSIPEYIRLPGIPETTYEQIALLGLATDEVQNGIVEDARLHQLWMTGATALSILVFGLAIIICF